MNKQILGACLLFLVSHLALAVHQGEHQAGYSLPKLEFITSESAKGFSVFNIHVHGGIRQEDIEITEKSSYLQLSFLADMSFESGREFQGSGPYIEKIKVYKESDHRVAIRLFTSKSPQYIRSALDTSILNKRLTLTLDHRTIESALNIRKEPKPKVLASSKTSAEPHLRNVAIVSICLLVLLLASMLIKAHINRLRIARFGAGSLLKNLGSLSLSPKHKVVLLEVGSERILVSVAPDGISMMTKIAPPAPPPQAQPMQKSPVMHPTQARVASRRAPQTLKEEPQVVPPSKEEQEKNSVDEITKLIRQKLQTLPSL